MRKVIYLNRFSKSERVTFIEDINKQGNGSGKLTKNDDTPIKQRSSSFAFGKLSTKRTEVIQKSDARPEYDVREASKFVRQKVLASMFSKAKKQSFAEVQAKRSISPGAGKYESLAAGLKFSPSKSRRRL